MSLNHCDQSFGGYNVKSKLSLEVLKVRNKKKISIIYLRNKSVFLFNNGVAKNTIVKFLAIIS